MRSGNCMCARFWWSHVINSWHRLMCEWLWFFKNTFTSNNFNWLTRWYSVLFAVWCSTLIIAQYEQKGMFTLRVFNIDGIFGSQSMYLSVIFAGWLFVGWNKSLDLSWNIANTRGILPNELKTKPKKSENCKNRCNNVHHKFTTAVVFHCFHSKWKKIILKWWVYAIVGVMNENDENNMQPNMHTHTQLKRERNEDIDSLSFLFAI